MAGSLTGDLGGIFALCRLIDRHGEAVEYDLLMAGRSLDDLGDTLTWRDLKVLTGRWMVTPGFALCDAVAGVTHWGVTDQLLADLLDEVRLNTWVTSGKSSAPKPKRMKRPWEESAEKKFGADAIALNDFDSWWESANESR